MLGRDETISSLKRDDETEQHIIAVEFAVWSDTYEQAVRQLKYGLNRTEFDYEVEVRQDG